MAKCKHLNGQLSMEVKTHLLANFAGEARASSIDTAELDYTPTGRWDYYCFDCNRDFSYQISRAPNWLKERAKAYKEFGLDIAR